MCDECGQTPCDFRCPNASGPQVVYRCTGCGADILEEDKYLPWLGERWCEDCVRAAWQLNCGFP